MKAKKKNKMETLKFPMCLRTQNYPKVKEDLQDGVVCNIAYTTENTVLQMEVSRT